MMKLLRYLLMSVTLFSLNACSTTPSVINNPAASLYEEQEFVLTPEDSGIRSAATSRIPRLIVRLSIKPEINATGQTTGRRYGQAAFFWTDKSRSNGGSNLGGVVNLSLRDAKNPDDTSWLGGSSTPIMSNSDLYKETGYADHIATTPAIQFAGPLCIQVPYVYLVSTNGYRFIEQSKFDENHNGSFVLTFCQPSKVESETDISNKRLQDVTFIAPVGKPFPFTQGIINSGSRPVSNVTVTFDIAYAIGFEFIDDKSSLFNCSSQRFDEMFLLRVSCHAPELKIGLTSLPLMFTIKNELQHWNIFDIESRVTSPSPDTDLNNNYSLSVVIVSK